MKGLMKYILSHIYYMNYKLQIRCSSLFWKSETHDFVNDWFFDDFSISKFLSCFAEKERIFSLCS